LCARVWLKVTRVPTWNDVREIALALPETSEFSQRGELEWHVKDKVFVWERRLRRADREALGERTPRGPILGAYVLDVEVKQALLTDYSSIYFTIPRFDGHPAILVRLERISLRELVELVIESWLVRAPKRLANQYLDLMRDG
jgi:hypothetical protein